MKFKYRLAVALAATTLAVLTGCGKSSPDEGAPGGIGGIGAPIGPGYPGGCLPLSAQIGFVASNGALTALQFAAGTSPSGASYGTVQVTTALAGGPYTDTGVDGAIMMNIQPLNPGTASATGYTQANAQGVLNIAPATQSDILFQATGTPGGYTAQPYPYPYPQPGYPQPYPQPAASSVCVSGMAFITGSAGGYALYGTKVYLYLSNSRIPYYTLKL